MSTALRSDLGDDAVSLYGPAAEPAAPPPDPPPPPPDPAAWQAELVELLAGLEHVRWGLLGLPLGTGAAALLSFAEGTLQAVEGLAQDTPFPPDTADAQAEAVAKAGAFVSQLAALRPAPGGLLRSVFAAFGDHHPLPPAEVKACLLAHHEALAAYFAVFTAHFQSSKAARGWVSAASCFLTDYKAMIRDLA
jgi:hypothetical protein